MGYHEVVKLSGAENYLQWQREVRAELAQAEIHILIKDDYITPTPVVITDTGSSADKKPEDGKLSETPITGAIESARAMKKATKKAARKAKYDKHMRADEKALTAIQMTVNDPVYRRIKHITDARESWRKLEELYGKTPDAIFEEALHKLSHMDFNDYNDLQVYQVEFEVSVSTVEEMSSTLPKRVKEAYFKMGLPRYLQRHCSLYGPAV